MFVVPDEGDPADGAPLIVEGVGVGVVLEHRVELLALPVVRLSGEAAQDEGVDDGHRPRPDDGRRPDDDLTRSFFDSYCY